MEVVVLKVEAVVVSDSTEIDAVVVQTEMTAIARANKVVIVQYRHHCDRRRWQSPMKTY